jgi:hypothetical protein
MGVRYSIVMRVESCCKASHVMDPQPLGKIAGGRPFGEETKREDASSNRGSKEQKPRRHVASSYFFIYRTKIPRHQV